MGRLLHTIGRVCQSAYEQGKSCSVIAVLKRLPVMVLGKSMVRLLHTIGRVYLSAYERSKPGSAAAVLKRLPVMVLRQEHGQAAVYHWSALSVSTRAKQAWFSSSGSKASSRDGLTARAWAGCCIPLTGSVGQHTSEASLVQQ